MRTFLELRRRTLAASGSAVVLAAVTLLIGALPIQRLTAQRVSDASPRSLVQLAPEDTVLVLRSRDPLATLERFAEARGLRSDPSLGGLIDTETAKRLAWLRGGLKLIGGGREARTIREALAGEVVAGVAVRHGAPASFLLAWGKDADETQETTQRIASLVRGSARAARAGALSFALPRGGAVSVADELVVIASDAHLTDEIVDAYARRAWRLPVSAAPEPAGPVGGSREKTCCLIEARLDLGRIRRLLGDGLGKAATNPGSLLFVAPWIEALAHGETAVARLDLDAERLALSVSVPRALESVAGAKRDLILSEDFDPDLVPSFAGEIARVSLSTSLRAFFQRRAELLDRDALSQTEQAVSFLTFFFGRKFDHVVLKNVNAGIHFVVGREPWERLERAPRVRFPTVAAVLGFPDRALAGSLHDAFASFVFVGNADRTEKGQSLFKVEKDIFMDIDLSTARLRPGWKGDPPTEAGFSPSVAVVGGRAVLSTSESLTTALVETIARETGQRRRAPQGDRVLASLRVSAPGAIELLRDARPALRVNEMLESAKSRAEVDHEFDTLLAFLGNVRSLAASFVASENGDLRLFAALELQPAGRVAKR